MRSLILTVLVLMLWGCAGGMTPTRQLDKSENAIPEETSKEKTTSLVQTTEGQQESQEAQEEQEEQEEEQEDERMSTPAESFSYEEWTAEPPTHGKPKIPGAPFPYLEDEGKRGLFDRLRRLRWAVWEHELYVITKREWRRNWDDWLTSGALQRLARNSAAKQLCILDGRYFHLRAGDKDLKRLLAQIRVSTSKIEEVTGVQPDHNLYDYRQNKDLRAFFEIHFVQIDETANARGDYRLRSWNHELEKLWEKISDEDQELIKKDDDIIVGENKRDYQLIKEGVGCEPPHNRGRINSCFVPVLRGTHRLTKSSPPCRTDSYIDQQP